MQRHSHNPGPTRSGQVARHGLARVHDVHTACKAITVQCLQEARASLGDPLQALLEGRAHTVEYAGGNCLVDARRGGRVVLPGSFNPIHEGHRHASCNQKPTHCSCLIQGPKRLVRIECYVLWPVCHQI